MQGFFCQLPAATVGKIQRLAKARGLPQRAIVEMAVDIVPELKLPQQHVAAFTPNGRRRLPPKKRPSLAQVTFFKRCKVRMPDGMTRGDAAVAIAKLIDANRGVGRKVRKGR